MKFYLVDKIERIDPGRRIVAIKNLSLAEEYLADHFPAFPVMPGVLMLEALVQTAAWLVRLQQDWSYSLIVLQAARNIRYANFVAPGHTLRMDVELVSLEGQLAKFKALGTLEDGREAVSGKLELKCLNVADVFPPGAAADPQILASLREQFKIIGGPDALAAAAAQ